MLDPDIEERANELKRLDYDQMQFLERRLGILMGINLWIITQ